MINVKVKEPIIAAAFTFIIRHFTFMISIRSYKHLCR
jgi:hypothetical protein